MTTEHRPSAKDAEAWAAWCRRRAELNELNAEQERIRRAPEEAWLAENPYPVNDPSYTGDLLKNPHIAETLAWRRKRTLWRVGEANKLPSEGYLRTAQCVDGHVYLVSARNIFAAVYKAKDFAFTGARTKFDRVFLDDEDHWDTGAPYGTVKPVIDLGPAPEGWTLETLITLDAKHATERERIYDAPKAGRQS